MVDWTRVYRFQEAINPAGLLLGITIEKANCFAWSE